MSYSHYPVQGSTLPKLNARFLSISFSKDEQDWSSVLHTHYFTELFFVTKGKGLFLFHDESHPIEAGDLVIIPPYIEHTEQSIKGLPLEYYAISLDGVSFQKQGASNYIQVFCNFGSARSLIENLFDQMLYEVRNHGYGSDRICQNLLEILILRITRSQNLVPVALNSAYMTKECAQIKAYLDAHYAEHITLDTLTKLTHMNKYYMAHSFAKYTGISPIQYLNKKRMEAACTLLTDTDYPIATISSSIGFSSQSYFTQTFRKNYGVTPIKYRQMHASVS